MKTAQRILVTSLALFNEHGEANVSSVDIANELDISPGNLYYHFKGKDVIVTALFELYQHQLQHLLNAAVGKQLNVHEFYYYLFMVLDKVHLFRFFYRSPSDLMDTYPQLRQPFSHLTNRMHKAFAEQVSSLQDQGAFTGSTADKQQFVEMLTLLTTQSISYFELRQVALDETMQRYQCLAMLLHAGLPYLSIPEDELLRLQHAITEHTLTDLIGQDWSQALKE